MRVSRLALTVWILSPWCVSWAADDPAAIEFFENRIRPVLVEHCYKCHAADADKVRGKLLLDTREATRAGGETGPAVVPGKPEKSLLLSAIKHEDLEMPPDRRLPKEVVADFEKWIRAGAADPREGPAAADVVHQEIDIEAGRKFWAFQPVVHPSVPNVRDKSWPRDEIDAFVLARLEDAGLQPVAAADTETLLRRLCFDLTGLPPTVEQRARFERATAANVTSAVVDLVDELLDSPAFGERWGRHWLDVARYGESNGNSRNATFPYAWRYRDYVIQAFNRDTPYDEFIQQQIAGDLLPAPSVDERNRNLIATGFLALGSKPVIRGGNGKGFIPDVAADQIEVTMRGILGMTVFCARCHDHKFDPIPTTDYYALAGIFASSQTLYGGSRGNMGGAPATGFHVLASRDAGEVKAYEDWKKRLANLQKRQREVGREVKKLRPRKKGAAPKNPQKYDQLLAEQKEIAKELKKLQQDRVEPPGQAMGIAEGDKVTEVPVYVRGEKASGPPIPRHFLTVAYEGEMPSLPPDSSGRLELAQWLTSPSNPLAARVIVNRIWSHLFGEGLVRTVDNFGVNGDRPTHPELLDYLAAEFVANDWSMKRFIKRLVLTRTYQLSSAHQDKNYEADPDNLLLWRHPRWRLEAEAIRDAILTASGQLDLTPPQGSVVESRGEVLIQDKLTPDTFHQPSNHRSVYLPILRNGLPEMLEVFDLGDPSLVVGKRDTTTVPSQDLYLMNSPFVIEQAQHFARLLQAEAKDDGSRIELAYLRALGRQPTDPERQRAASFLAMSREALEKNTADTDQRLTDAWASLCQALFVSAEFRYLR